MPGKAGDPDRSDGDNRLFVNGVLWVCAPERIGTTFPNDAAKWKTLHKRFRRWSEAGVWERVFADRIHDPGKDYLMLHSTLVRGPAGSDPKRGQEPGFRALPRWIDHQDPHGHG
ncbi:transposase [Mesorhizobium sp. 128a]